MHVYERLQKESYTAAETADTLHNISLVCTSATSLRKTVNVFERAEIASFTQTFSTDEYNMPEKTHTAATAPEWTDS